MRTIFSSDGLLLKFPDVKHSIWYEKAMLKVSLETYVNVRNEYGIWATNQNKFVPNIEDLAPMDSLYMEMRMVKHEQEFNLKIFPYRGFIKANYMLAPRHEPKYYTAEDFTQEEADRENLLYLAVVKQGLSVCRVCGRGPEGHE